jgi:hypothetical protein
MAIQKEKSFRLNDAHFQENIAQGRVNQTVAHENAPR